MVGFGFGFGFGTGCCCFWFGEPEESEVPLDLGPPGWSMNEGVGPPESTELDNVVREDVCGRGLNWGL